jgi:hypothetical protein
MPIYPTGTCFDDSLDYLEQVLNIEALTPEQLAEVERDHRIVHGICVGSAGVRYAHAWVEQRSRDDRAWLVWQAGVLDGERIYFGRDRADYLATDGVERCTRYTLRIAAELNRIYGTYGPWRAEYLELARSGGDMRVVGSSRGAVPVAIGRVGHHA